MAFARVRLSTGPELHYAEQGNQDGAPVIFLHGWPDSWFTYSRVLPLLPPDIHAFTPDQRGFGDSDRPEHGYDIDDFAADVLAFMDAMSLTRAAFVGHSFGSFVARALAIAAPARVDRLVLIGTGIANGNAVIDEVRAAMVHLRDPVSDAFAREFQASTAYAPLPEAFFDLIVAESLKLPARVWRAALDGLAAYDDRPQLARITHPTHLLWGDQDALFSRAHQERVLAAIAGSTLTVYEETGHCPNWERPELVAADLAQLLRAQ